MALKINNVNIVDNSQNLNITGVSTFSSNPIFIGAATSTGTASQPLQVTGGASFVGTGSSVGIGTTNPTQKLDVVGNIRLRNSLYDVNNNVGTAGSVLISTGVGVSWINFSGGATLQNDVSTNATWYPTLSNSISGSYTTAYVSNTNLQYNPSSGTLFATVFTSLSDKNKKTNIRNIYNSIEIVKQLNGVRFDWVEDGKPSIGVIAQDIEKVLPEVVQTNEDGMKTVSYGNIIGVLIEAIKEQQKCIEELDRKLNA
jgi:hypothetical protein